ncbi:hypothetical protein D3C84_760150 [compost metagenome]|jgi:hypothetical protein
MGAIDVLAEPAPSRVKPAPTSCQLHCFYCLIPESIMNRLPSIGLCLALSAVCAQGWAETVVPIKGQSAQQVQTDINDCHNVAASSTTSQPHVGGRVRGAAVGAAAGAAGAEVRGRQHDEVYDRVDDDVKQQYRQNRAGETAAAGAVVGGARQRQERREDRRTSEATSASAYTSCLQNRGYQVTP